MCSAQLDQVTDRFRHEMLPSILLDMFGNMGYAWQRLLSIYATSSFLRISFSPSIYQVVLFAANDVQGISCCSQWCWDCLADHIMIERYGNDWHDARCPLHTDNLPPYV